jgi:hypothetical protein
MFQMNYEFSFKLNIYNFNNIINIEFFYMINEINLQSLLEISLHGGFYLQKTQFSVRLFKFSHIQGSQVRFPGTTQKSSGSGTGSIQPHECN